MTTRLQRIAAPPRLELWLADLAIAPDAGAEEALDENERARAARFVFERDRRRYVHAHVALRELLAARTGAPPADLRFAESEFGKPRLLGDTPLAFNLAHSADSALIGLADGGEIGVDIETLRALPDLDDLARRVLTAGERRELDALAAHDRPAAFLRAWTRKEACVKAIGAGLQVEPASFSTGLDGALPRLELPFRGRSFRLTVDTLATHRNVAISWAMLLDTP